MQVKSFRAATISLALDQVKKELGPDAIILGNKQIAISPTESYVEVMAAIEPQSEQPESPPAKATQIQEDIQEIKGFLSLLISSKDHFTQLQMQQPVAELYHSLLTRGLDEKQAFILLSRALAKFERGSVDRRQVIDAFCQQLFASIKLTRPFQDLPQGAAHAFAFVGPTGVGKTTTLAKMAAYLKIKRGLEVAFISIDTYRIGAVDQLQTYADILNIPLVVAQSATEFRLARERFAHHDVVLVDTTGKNFLQRQHIEDLQTVLAGGENLRHLLVLSATAKDDDLKQTIVHFRPMGVQSLIFTKTDETMNHGSMINQLLRFPCPLSYLGTGQRVPEDLELATPKRLLSFLFPARK